MNTKQIEVNGVPLIAREDGSIVRLKKESAAKKIITYGSNTGHGYLRVSIKNRMIYMHRIIAEAFLPNYTEKLEVDHINGDKSDNRLCNLRMVTTAENSRAFKRKSNGKPSKYKGVCWYKAYSNWMVNIKINQKPIFVGYYKDEIEAAKAYDAKAIELGFDVQALNFKNNLVFF